MLVVVRILPCRKILQGVSYMKPAPPVIMMFFTSGSGSNLVDPIRTGARFQTEESSKKFGVDPLAGEALVMLSLGVGGYIAQLRE